MRGGKGAVGWEVEYTYIGPVIGVSAESSDLFFRASDLSTRPLGV